MIFSVFLSQERWSVANLLLLWILLLYAFTVLHPPKPGKSRKREMRSFRLSLLTQFLAIIHLFCDFKLSFTIHDKKILWPKFAMNSKGKFGFPLPKPEYATIYYCLCYWHQTNGDKYVKLRPPPHLITSYISVSSGRLLPEQSQGKLEPKNQKFLLTFIPQKGHWAWLILSSCEYYRSSICIRVEHILVEVFENFVFIFHLRWT